MTVSFSFCAPNNTTEMGDNNGKIQAYIKTKRIDAFIGSILEELIKSRPEKPVEHSIEFILSRFPNETNAVVERIKKLNIRCKSDSRPTSPMKRNHQDLETEIFSYVEQHGLNSLFAGITQRILLEKPVNPPEFVLEYWLEENPSAVFKVIRNIFPQSIVGEKNDDCETDDETGMFVTVDELKPVDAEQLSTRRKGISSEALDLETLKDNISQIAQFPKSEEVTVSLHKIISKSALLRRMLDMNQRDLLVRAFAGPVVKGPGETIVQQGDMGHTFYYIAEGSVDVYIRRDDSDIDDDMKVHTYRAGDAFGQIALIYNTPRVATCKVAEEATLWMIDRFSFRLIIAGSLLLRAESIIMQLQAIPILRILTEVELHQLAELVIEEFYEEGSILCKQGDNETRACIVVEGAVDCVQMDAYYNKKVKKTVEDSQYFGEYAFLSTVARQASMRAKVDTTVFVIDVPLFTRMFGEMESLLVQRNFELFRSKYENAVADILHNIV